MASRSCRSRPWLQLSPADTSAPRITPPPATSRTVSRAGSSTSFPNPQRLEERTACGVALACTSARISLVPLSLVGTAIVCWTTRIDKAADNVRRNGGLSGPSVLRYVSPRDWNHMILTADHDRNSGTGQRSNVRPPNLYPSRIRASSAATEDLPEVGALPRSASRVSYIRSR